MLTEVSKIAEIAAVLELEIAYGWAVKKGSESGRDYRFPLLAYYLHCHLRALVFATQSNKLRGRHSGTDRRVEGCSDNSFQSLRFTELIAQASKVRRYKRHWWIRVVRQQRNKNQAKPDAVHGGIPNRSAVFAQLPMMNVPV